jgi:hypothetical protein
LWRATSPGASSAFAVCITLLASPSKQIPAFPGAEGAGAFTTGGRGGATYIVTNLNTAGPGSLADAVSQPNRTIVFTVSGTIDLGGGQPGRRGTLKIDQPNITIAGQTAPGEGICLRNGGIHVAAGNVIIRYLRIRRGFIKNTDTGDALNIKGQFENVMADHVSASWSTDENLTLTNANNVTAQYCLNSEGLDYVNARQSPWRHSEGSLFGSAYSGGHMTIHHTVYAHNRLRNVRTTGGGERPPELDFRNNVIYDCKELTTHTGSQKVHLNLVGNYYKDGPSTGIEGHDVKGVIFTFMSTPVSHLFAEGNHVEGYPDRTARNWTAVRFRKTLKYSEKESRAEKPFETPFVTTQSALEAYETTLTEAGATLPSRDAIDLRIVNDVRNGTGAVINRETDIPEKARWQTYHALPAPADTDHDGMPDYWEEQFGLDKNSAADAVLDSDGDGYTNLESYLNNTDPKGGAMPIVYVSATISRAYRDRPAEFRINRTGDTAKPLEVRYTVSGAALSGKVNIPAGAKFTRIAVAPAPEGLVVIHISAQPAYHIGCPRQALVAIESGAPPPKVNIAGIAPDGGGTAEDRKLADAEMADHKVFKKAKLENRDKKK